MWFLRRGSCKFHVSLAGDGMKKSNLTKEKGQNLAVLRDST